MSYGREPPRSTVRPCAAAEERTLGRFLLVWLDRKRDRGTAADYG